MALYTRVDYEKDMRELEVKEALLTEMLVTCACGCLPQSHRKTKLDRQMQDVAGASKGNRSGGCKNCEGCGGFESLISGFMHRDAMRLGERLREHYKGKLVSTGMILRDKELMQKSFWFAWVIRRKTMAPLLKHQSGKYVETTENRIKYLASRGVTILDGTYKPSNKEADEGKWEPVKKDVGGHRQAGEPAIPEENYTPVWKKVTTEQGKRILALGGMVRFLQDWPPKATDHAETTDWDLLEETKDHGSSDKRPAKDVSSVSELGNNRIHNVR